MLYRLFLRLDGVAHCLGWVVILIALVFVGMALVDFIRKYLGR